MRSVEETLNVKNGSRKEAETAELTAPSGSIGEAGPDN